MHQEGPREQHGKMEEDRTEQTTCCRETGQTDDPYARSEAKLLTFAAATSGRFDTSQQVAVQQRQDIEHSTAAPNQA